MIYCAVRITDNSRHKSVDKIEESKKDMMNIKKYIEKFHRSEFLLSFEESVEIMLFIFGVYQFIKYVVKVGRI